MSVVLVTGCSSGFGLAFATAFAQRGDQVVATMRDTSRAPNRLTGVDVRQMDVTKSETFAAIVAGILRDYGRIDVLVNNAGIATIGAVEVLDDQAFRSVFETNFFGAMALSRAVLPHMRKQGSGRIIFMSAVGALLNTAYLSAYCTSKAALSSLAAAMDTEVRPFGIRVSAILPSAYKTEIAGNMTLAADERTVYEKASRGYFAGLTQRIIEGPADLSPVVDAVLHAATSEQPRHMYLVAPRLAEVLQPLVDGLEKLHEHEMELTRPLQG